MARRFEQYAALGKRVRRELRAAGIKPIAGEANAAPNVTSFELPPGSPELCREAGFQIAHASCYLQAQGWGQIATMGDFGDGTDGSLDALFGALRAAERIVTEHSLVG